MKDLSLHVLDIAQNSVTAGAKHLDISLADGAGLRTLVITDDGRGMAPDFLAAVTDPFTTTRSTRKVGLGLPLLRMAAEQTGGGLQIESKLGVGTRVSVSFYYEHIDCPPVGDMAGTVALLVQGAPELELRYTRDGNTFDTREVRAVLGPDISLSAPEVVLWMQDYMKELSL